MLGIIRCESRKRRASVHERNNLPSSKHASRAEETVHQIEIILLKENGGRKTPYFPPPTCKKMHYEHRDVSSHDALRFSLGIMASGSGTCSINHGDWCRVYPSEACRNSICTVQLFCCAKTQPNYRSSLSRLEFGQTSAPEYHRHQCCFRPHI